jgi:hypothetical protein
MKELIRVTTENGNSLRTLEDVRNMVVANCDRVAKVGNWPAHIPVLSLAERVPSSDERAPGFDAGIACALGLIPTDRQALSCKLHAAYTEEAVAQVRQEIVKLRQWYRNSSWDDTGRDSETMWWLLACSFCTEKQTPDEFLEAVEQFAFYARTVKQEKTADGPACRALNEYDKMSDSYLVAGGVPVATKDGGMQAAYIHGHDLAIQPANFGDDQGLWFVGTYKECGLGLEDFEWDAGHGSTRRYISSGEIDPKGNSGPVHGSKQFVKTGSLWELERVVSVARRHLHKNG